MEQFSEYEIHHCKSADDLNRALIAGDSMFRMARHGAGWKLLDRYDTKLDLSDVTDEQQAVRLASTWLQGLLWGQILTTINHDVMTKAEDRA
jgi:hypothetical protein